MSTSSSSSRSSFSYENDEKVHKESQMRESVSSNRSSLSFGNPEEPEEEPEEPNSPLSKWFLIPQRLIFAIMGAFAGALTYALRTAVNVHKDPLVSRTHMRESVSSNRSSFSFGNPEEPEEEPEEPDPPLSKWFLIPQRLVFAIMGAFACALTYALRTAVNVTIQDYNISKVGNTCHVSDDRNGTEYRYLFVHKWKSGELLFSSFYWGYLLTQVPGGYLADRYGGKYVVVFGLIGSSLWTMIYPRVLEHSEEDIHLVVGIQFVHGIFQGVILPAITSMVAKWAPTNERTTIFCFVYGSIYFGTFLARILGDVLIKRAETWQPVFYFFGGVGLLCSLVWILLCFSSPQSNRFIRGAEKSYLLDNLGQVDSTRIIVPWQKILKSTSFWAIVFLAIGDSSMWHIIHQNLLFYLDKVLMFGNMYDPSWTATPYLFGGITAMCSACISDWLIYKKHVSTTLLRKSFTAISMIGTGIMLLFASYAGCQAIKAIIYFTMAVAFAGSLMAGATVSIIDLTPNFAGTFRGLVGIPISFAAMVSPLLVTRMALHNTLEQWNHIFWYIFFLLTGTSLMYVIMGSATEQRWNRPKKKMTLN